MSIARLTFRLFAALLTSLSMLHGTLEGSSVACSSSAGESAHGAMSMPAAGARAGHEKAAASASGGHSDAAQPQSEHRAPTQERCCESMSSCSVTIVASTVERSSARRSASRIPAHPELVLASVDATLEPPPPKA